MLNKPTNVSPYNEFIDINSENGLELNFTLNNVVDGVCIELYDEENTPVFSDLIINTEKKRDFTYTIPDTSLLSNGKNYYWKARYWNEPKEEDRVDKEYLCVNYWNSQRQVVGLLPPSCISSPIDFKVKKITKDGNDYIDFEFDKDIPERSYDGEYDKYRFFLAFPEVGVYAWIDRFGDDDIKCMQVFLKGEETIDIEVLSSLIVDKDVRAGIFNINKETKSNSLNTGEYIKLSYDGKDVIYKIFSPDNLLEHNDGLYLDWIYSVGANVKTSHFHLPASEDGAVYCKNIASVYNKCEYNESPPYYFSCREDPSGLMSFNNIPDSISSPQIELCANIGEYIDINSYRYQLSKLVGTNNWEMIWESDKLNSVTLLEDGTLNTETVIYKGVTPQNKYRIKLVGQTFDGVDFEIEESFESSNFIANATRENFVSFNKNLGCVEINNSAFISPSNTSELQIYRYDILKKELDFVSATPYSFSVTTEKEGYSKRTTTYDFNIVSDAEYIYYAFVIDNYNIISSYVSNHITPSWDGVYLTDVVYENSIIYIPDLSKVWFIGLNFEPSEITRTYQVSHPYGVGQKYPKSIRGKGVSKTGQISGLLGTIACTSGDYDENVYLIEEFEDFCSNGKLKLIRSSVKGEHLIADIDKMSSSEFGQVATSIGIAYTQIDDMIRKRISVEV